MLRTLADHGDGRTHHLVVAQRPDEPLFEPELASLARRLDLRITRTAGRRVDAAMLHAVLPPEPLRDRLDYFVCGSPSLLAGSLAAIEQLVAAGVPVGVMVAPIVPAINDAEIETILTRAAARGAREAGYVMLRLPLELTDLFEEWLLAHFPAKHRHVMTLVASMRKGKTYDAAWGERMTGTGPFSWMIGRRFELALAKNGYRKERLKLRTDLFERPVKQGEQLSLL